MIEFQVCGLTLFDHIYVNVVSMMYATNRKHLGKVGTPAYAWSNGRFYNAFSCSTNSDDEHKQFGVGPCIKDRPLLIFDQPFS